MKSIGTNKKSNGLIRKSIGTNEANIGFTVNKNIGTNEKALVSLRKA